MRRLFVLLFAAATGYISLTQEMLWMRIVSYVSGGEPTVFAHVLGFFLIGVAAGALIGERLCARRFASAGGSAVRFVGQMLIASAVFYFVSIAAVATLLTWSPAAGRLAINGVVVVVSLLLGGIFPVLCHYAARAGENVGITVSRVYLANIVGSTLGPLLTGFILMQYLPTARIVLLLSVATALLGASALLFDPSREGLASGLTTAAVVIAVIFALNPLLYPHLLERLQSNSAGKQYKYLLENRSGIIAVEAGKYDEHGGPQWPDLIYGGGMYDGRFNTYPANRWYNPQAPEKDKELRNTTDVSNYIGRCYVIAALHPNPAEVLEIGLSSASWTRVMANYPPIRHLTSVEINAGYKDIIRHYPEQGSILDEPERIDIQIDDGRRWLNRHPDARFDFILQNTTWHWRSEITNLLSVEYLRLAKSRLKPGGVLYWNTTHSEDVKRTAAMVFAHVVHYANFIAASDAPFDLTPDQVRDNLRKFTSGGRPVFDEADPLLKAALEDYARYPLVDEASYWRNRQDLWVITDDNMATEFKRARSDEGSGTDRTRWFDRTRSWHAFFRG